MNISLDFYCDRPYLKGVDHEEVRLTKKLGKSLDRFLVQKPRAIFAMLNYGGKLMKFKTGEKILPKQFDFYTNRVKKNVAGAFEWNLQLDTFKSNIHKGLMQARLEGKLNTHEDVRAVVIRSLIGGLPVKSQKTLLYYYDEWVKERSLHLKHQTIKKYGSLRSWLDTYQKHSRKRLYFEDVNRDFDNEFRLLLLDSGLLNGSMQKYYATLKVFMTWGLDNGYHKSLDYRKFKKEKTTTDIIYLTQEELDAIYHVDLSKWPGKAKVRDIFIFQCLTGQRFSDIKNVKCEDIRKIGDRYEWHLFQIKGNKDSKVTIPLSKRATEIFLKIGRPEGYVFPCNSDVTTNRMLKGIAKVAGICQLVSQVKYSGIKRIEVTKPKYEFVTTHCARRTFTTLSLEKNLRPEVVMKITGHSDYKTMKLYMKLVDSVVKKEMLDAWD